MSQTYDDIDQSTDTQTEVNTKLDDRTDTLRSNFSGSSAPGSPVEGQVWVDTSAVPYIVKAYLDIGAGAAWVTLGPVARLNGDINLDPSSGDTRATCNQIKGARIENRGAHVAAAAGNVGFVYLLTGDGEVYYLENTVAGARKAVLSILPSASLDSVEVDLNAVQLGASPPTAWTAGTSPAARGYLFDDTGESLTIPVVVPANFSDDADCYLDTFWALDAAETAADDIEVSCNWVAVSPAADAVNKSSTAATMAATDIGAVTTQYSVFKVRITLDFDDATNPIDAGDLILAEINRTTIGGAGKVAGAALIGARFVFPQKPRFSRA